MKRVALYLRVSTLHQDYERQRNEIEAFCHNRNMKITHVFEEKISGANNEREQFKRMCLLSKDEIDCVVVWEMSRLGRSLSTVINAVEDFSKRGINVIALKENFTSLDDNGKQTPTATMMLSMLSAMAVIERNSIIERTKSGRKERILSGQSPYSLKAPFGYSRTANGLEVNEEEAIIVRDIFDKYLNGFTQNEIGTLYNMTQVRVSRILHNSVYTGKPFSNVVQQIIGCPQIVDDDIFNKANEMCKNNFKARPTRENKHPLRGKFICSVCGHNICKKGDTWGCHCGKSNISEKFMNQAVELVLSDYSASNATDDKSITQGELKSMQSKCEGLERLHEANRNKLNEATKKYELLLPTFGESQLIKEKSEVMRLQGKASGYEKELNNIRLRIREMKSKTAAPKEKPSDSIERVTLFVVSKTEKMMVFDLYGATYQVTILTRKGEVLLQTIV